MSTISRFKVNYITDVGVGCWLWVGLINRDGYGVFQKSGCGSNLAHRFSYQYFIGSIGDGLELDHLCRVRRCVNPWHLEPVTGRENWLRSRSPSAINIKKTHCVRGHVLGGDNLRSYMSNFYGTPTRQCRICTRIRQNKYDFRKKVDACNSVEGGV